MKKQKLLVIDDDVRLSEALIAYLHKYSYETYHASHPSEGLKAVGSFCPDLIILDIMMPDMDGLEVCREIRRDSEVPIIFLSARGETTDRIVGLEIGADDYLPKPFEPRELVARIESVLRRPRATATIVGPGLSLDEDSMTANLDGSKVDFTANEFQALSFLVKNKGRIVSRDDLLTFLQGIDSEVYGRAIDILISRIRQKLNDDAKESRFIKTIRGQGYRFIGGGQ